MLVSNKKAFHKYSITDKYEAGIDLLGTEVKSLRNGGGSLEGAYVSTRSGEALLVGANISAYQPANVSGDYEPTRTRRLLLTKKEINKLSGLESQKGLTVVPLNVYDKNGKIKVEIGVARGKKEFDKRDVLKKRSSDRDIDREIKKWG
ncbi:MAG: SsrA-binding protein SmpB [Candidatus Paceibacterota bacterium]|jgi:SsrA-binding protein